MKKIKKIEVLTFLILSVFVQPSYFYELYDQIKIGGLFDEPTNDAEWAFQYAVEAVNNQRYNVSDNTFETLTMRVEYGNQFDASKKLCRLLKAGVWAVLGPSSPEAALHVHSICDSKEMPLIETRFNSYSHIPIMNLHPHPPILGHVFYDLIKTWEWQDFTILFESPSWLPYLDKLLKMYDSKGHLVTVRQLELPNLHGNYRPILSRVKSDGIKNIVLSCSIDILPEVLKQALQVGIMTEHHQYIITSLDMHTIDLEPYRYGDTNITGVRLVIPTDPIVRQVTDFFKTQHETKAYKESGGMGSFASSDPNFSDFPEGLTADKLRVETALAYDSVLLFAETIRQHKEDGNLKAISMKCDMDNSTWTSGLTISNFMRDANLQGLSGHIRFDHQGHRSDFELEVIELVSTGLHKIGTWNSSSGLNITRQYVSYSMPTDNKSLQNKSFVVLIAISKPYGMLKENIQKLSGNDRFEGFGIELIDELSRMLGFNYTFKLQEDNVYGSKSAVTGLWNGMVLEIMEDRADLGITDLTITSDRQGAVDFTGPFMNLGISILYQKPTKENPSLFSFMSPFSNQVWACLGIAFFGVSLSLFVMARLSPEEWDNPYPCIEEPDVLENQFSYQNSVWFTIGALLQQGSEVAPKAASVRIVASIWYFFTLIMVSSYTANLAAFLTIETLVSPFDNVEQLANSKIPYGAKRDGSTINFFRDSNSSMYQKMYKWMTDHPQYLTSSNDEGVERAKKEAYAFLMESSSIDFIVERECKVTRVGGLLDAKGYGIAMKKDSPYRAPLSEAVLRLQETGKLSQMQIRWWKEKRGGGACAGSSAGDSAAEELRMANVGGVFVCLIAGGVCAIIVATFQMIYDVKQRSKELSIPFKEEFVEEIKFIAKCSQDTKILKKRKSSSRGSLESIPQTPQSLHSSRSRSRKDQDLI